LNQNQQQELSSHTLSVMRNHKDTVFRLLFNDPKELLQLYNALNNTDYTDESVLQVKTLEHAIYMGVKDDVAFILDSRLHIYEQQASFNPNMPLRDLVYIATHYTEYIRDKSIYSTRLVKIPALRFVVFYNGTQKQPERMIQKLSDAFSVPDQDPQLELKVLMLNINKGCNVELMSKCKTLREYCLFVQTVRDYTQTNPVEEAVHLAVEDCIQNDILRDFLLSQKAKVIQMAIYEFDVETEIRKLRESEFQYGVDTGREEGLIAGRAEGQMIGTIIGTIKTCQELGLTKEQTLAYLLKHISVTQEEAEQFLDTYWQ